VSITLVIVIAVTVSVVALDVWLEVTERETISELTWRTAARHPLVPFAAGLLCGHLFWQK
jgi:hypothetical protein